MIRPARRFIMPRRAERARPVLVLHAQQQPVAGHAGVGDQDGKIAAGGGLGARHQRIDGRAVGEVAHDARDPLAQRRGQSVQGRFARARQHDMCALGVQGAGDRPADAAAGPGHQGRLAGKIEHARATRVSESAYLGQASAADKGTGGMPLRGQRDRQANA
jgi:hypothetical protein